MIVRIALKPAQTKAIFEAYFCVTYDTSMFIIMYCTIYVFDSVRLFSCWSIISLFAAIFANLPHLIRLQFICSFHHTIPFISILFSSDAKKMKIEYSQWWCIPLVYHVVVILIAKLEYKSNLLYIVEISINSQVRRVKRNAEEVRFSSVDVKFELLACN